MSYRIVSYLVIHVAIYAVVDTATFRKLAHVYTTQDNARCRNGAATSLCEDQENELD